MLAKNRLMVALGFMAALMCQSSLHAEPSIYPTGVTRYDPAKAYNVFILFSGGDDKTHVIDMDGNEVHRWDHPGFPSSIIDPVLVGGARGHVLLQLSVMAGTETGMIPGMPALFKNKSIGELDWDGAIVWQWGENAPGGAAQQHHDWSRLPNGNTLVLSVLSHPIPGFMLPRLLDDAIYEVTPKGEIAWRWIAGEHLKEFGFTAQALTLVRKSEAPDYLHLNDMKPLGPNHWFREGDVRFDPNNIMVSSRDANFTVIIDKKSGHIAWRLGPTYPPTPKGPRKLPSLIDQISGQHDPHLIPEGLEGAGNLLMFDNQGEAGFPSATLKVFPGSRLLEIDPVKRQIVWEYTGSDSDAPEWSFFSAFISDVRRLPNGDFFVDEGMNGRFFQITPAGEIVWEYISPYFGPQPFGPAGKKVKANAVYRAQPVPYDWVPAGTPHAEQAVAPPDITTYRVPGRP